MLGSLILVIVTSLILSIIFISYFNRKIDKISNKIVKGNLVVLEDIVEIKSDIKTLDKMIVDTKDNIDVYVKKINREMIDEWRKDNIISQEGFDKIFKNWSPKLSYYNHINETLNEFDKWFKDCRDEYNDTLKNNIDKFLDSRHDDDLIKSYEKFYNEFINADKQPSDIVKYKNIIDEFTDKFNTNSTVRIANHENGIDDFTLSDLVIYILNRIVITKLLENNVFSELDSRIFLDRLTFARDSELIRSKHPAIYDFIDNITDNTLNEKSV